MPWSSNRIRRLAAIAAIACWAARPAMVAGAGPVPLTLGFDDLKTGTWGGDPAAFQVITTQYAGYGLTFDGVSLVDFSPAPVSGFLDSPPNAIQPCIISAPSARLLRCQTAIEIRFDVPQQRVSLSVGSTTSLPDGGVVSIIGSDASGVAVAKNELRLPPNPAATPIGGHVLAVEAEVPLIQAIAVTTSSGMEIGSLVVDDLTFVPPPPNLAFSGAEPTVGQGVIDLRVQVSNGGGPSAAIEVSLTSPLGDVAATVSELAPGQRAETVLRLPVASVFQGGTYPLTVRLDPGGLSGDIDVSDNQLTIQVVIPAASAPATAAVAETPSPETTLTTPEVTPGPVPSTPASSSSVAIAVAAGAITLTVLIGGVTYQIRVDRKRRDLELSATSAAPPKTCPPGRLHTQVSGSAFMSRRKIVSMRATGASRGTVRSPLELTGDALVPLNDVVFERGSLGAAELLARLRPTCEPLVRGVIEWAGSEEIRDLAIRVHVEGPSFPVKFQTRFCTGSGDGSRWHDLDSWERTLKDQLDAVAIEGATIDPSDGTSRSTLTDGLLTGLAGALGRF